MHALPLNKTRKNEPTPNEEKNAFAVPMQQMQDTSNLKMYKTTVTSDINAEKLASFYKPDIVISTSALKVIFNNFGPNYDSVWEIPVTIWMARGGRVIFLDKPLPRKNLTLFDKKRWYSKIATKSFLLHSTTKTDVETKPQKESNGGHDDAIAKKQVRYKCRSRIRREFWQWFTN